MPPAASCRNTFEELQAYFRRFPLLVIDGPTGSADLIKKKDFLRRIEEEERSRSVRSIVVVTIMNGLTDFARFFGEEERTFTVGELAQIAAVPYTVADSWITAGILTIDGVDSTKKERSASYRTAFIAALAGGLRRRQTVPLSLKVLKNVGDVIRGIEKARKETVPT
jgi:hypothetical protein